MKNLILTILATSIIITSTLSSAEIIPVWNKVNEGGMIHDIEFLRGEDKFIMLAGVEGAGAIQIRDTETGELISSFPMPNLAQYNQIEITPDSNRCLITTGGTRTIGPTIELRNLSDYSIISKDSLPIVDEPKDTQGDFYKYVFHEMIVDPIRPLVYIWIEKTTFSGQKDRFYLKVYNYETMQLVKDLTPSDYNDEWPSKELFQEDDNYCFDVSDDGRYLATLKEGKTYLKIWDLETYELIKDYQLYDSELTNPKDYRCEVSDIEFSSNDDDLIYFSGVFPNVENKPFPNGVFKYSKSTNTNALIDIGERYNRGLFTLFDQEKRIFISSGVEISIINHETLEVEINISSGLDLPYAQKILFSKVNKSFLGFALEYFISSIYTFQTSTTNIFEDEIIISPNPTHSYVNINLGCIESIMNYQVYNLNGEVIENSSVENLEGVIQVDFSNHPTGIYFITTRCNDQTNTFKVIKE